MNSALNCLNGLCSLSQTSKLQLSSLNILEELNVVGFGCNSSESSEEPTRFKDPRVPSVFEYKFTKASSRLLRSIVISISPTVSKDSNNCGKFFASSNGRRKLREFDDKSFLFAEGMRSRIIFSILPRSLKASLREGKSIFSSYPTPKTRLMYLGDPRQTKRPADMIPILSASSSASSISLVVIIIVFPILSRFRTCQIAVCEIGSNPVVGSSNTKMSALPIRAIAMASFRFVPPLISDIKQLLYSSMSVSSITLLISFTLRLPL
mmetsp:Transcript_17012/g.19077  ORF Transcript_17012/g.19077 Transcript_17012/m.19077 type:complete len:265 (+) Transcript_17012:44-838(+)